MYPLPMNPPTVRVADVLVDVRTGGQEAMWTYQAQPEHALGDAVLAPLGTRTVLGHVVRLREVDESGLGFPLEKLKPLGTAIQGLGLPPSLIALVEFIARETLSPLPVALSPAMPPGAQARIVTRWRPIPGVQADLLTPLQQELWRTIQEEGELTEAKAKKLTATMKRGLRLLQEKGLVESQRSVVRPQTRKGDDALLRLTADADRIEAFLHDEGKRKPAQALTLVRLSTADRPQFSREEIRALCGVTDQTIRALRTAKLLEPVSGEDAQRRLPPEPNADQAKAIAALRQSIEGRTPSRFLLFGITGSGKTEVFLRAAAEALKQGRQVLYLVPEIALATQAISQLRERFGERVTILHSELTPAERLENWIRIRQGEAPVVLGARSALFAPLDNIGLIVVDEEHESSYKQESSPRYHAKPAALELARLHSAPIVLGSATPSVESFAEAQAGKLIRLDLPSRTASARLPKVVLDDLREGYKIGQPVILGRSLRDRMTETLERGEQIILFLNRRAYSPFLLCRECGQQFQCPRCSVSLSYSRQDRRLRCHHCDYQCPPPEKCPGCGGIKLAPVGMGTEKVEEQVRQKFPEARVARLDRDVTRRKGALEEILAQFRAGDLDILVGTQMVAKGLDFPRVTLVGVVTADIALNIPDFRASERTFQLLSQVAGRAGRGSAPGEVVIQTFNPTHVALAAAETHDYVKLFNEVRFEREFAKYPPYCRLVNLIISGVSITETRTVSQAVADALRQVPDAEVLGPASAAVERVKERWRRNVLVKLPPDADVTPIGLALAAVTLGKTQLVIDVDPYSLM